ncbi:MAG: hypothetical protein R3B91_08830 [Planctomycetaceae bacterium]
MRFLPLTLCLLLTWTCLGGGIHPAWAQPATPEQAERIGEQLTQLQTRIESLPDSDWLPDVAVCAKAAEWILRHEEFYKPSYVDDTLAVLALGRERATELQARCTSDPSWMTGKRTVALGYRSAVDGSVQPYALSFPTNFDPGSPDPWPLTIKLHGRNGTLTEASFMQSFNNREMDLPVDSIQLDVFGRTNNAYRWSGETDVFEALADVQRRFRIDERRITLWGFSMGEPVHGIWVCTIRPGGRPSVQEPALSIFTNTRSRHPSCRHLSTRRCTSMMQSIMPSTPRTSPSSPTGAKSTNNWPPA